MDHDQYLASYRRDSARPCSTPIRAAGAATPRCPTARGGRPPTWPGTSAEVWEWWGIIVRDRARPIPDAVVQIAAAGHRSTRCVTFAERRPPTLDRILDRHRSGDGALDVERRQDDRLRACGGWPTRPPCTASTPSGPPAATYVIDPELASDGVDEFLFEFLERVAAGSRAAGRVGAPALHRRRRRVAGASTTAPAAYDVTREHAKGDAAIRGPADDLLLVLWRRLPLDAVEVIGDRAVAERLLARTRPGGLSRRPSCETGPGRCASGLSKSSGKGRWVEWAADAGCRASEFLLTREHMSVSENTWLARRVTDVVREVLAADLTTCDTAELTRVAVGVHRLRCWLDSIDAAVVARSADLALADGRRSLREADVVVERAVLCAAMPEVHEALATGTLSAGHADAIARAANRLDDQNAPRWRPRRRRWSSWRRRCRSTTSVVAVRDLARRISRDDGCATTSSCDHSGRSGGGRTATACATPTSASTPRPTPASPPTSTRPSPPNEPSPTTAAASTNSAPMPSCT